MVTEISIDDILNPERLDSIEQEVSKDVQREIAAQLQRDLAIPLPDDAEGKAKAIRDRQVLIDSIKTLNQILNVKPMPELESAPSEDEVDAYEKKWLIDNWMTRGELTLFSGEGGIGKSYMALQHACGLAMGIADFAVRPFFGEPHQITDYHWRYQPIKIVIASYEEDRMEIWKRIRRIEANLGWPDYNIVAKQVKMIDLKMFGPIWGVDEFKHLATRAHLLAVGEMLMGLCEEQNASLLIIDPAAGAFGANENDRAQVREFASYLNGWGTQIDCATLLISHPSKASSDYSGSTDWLGSPRSLWSLQEDQLTYGKGEDKTTDTWYQFINLKRNYAAPGRAVLLKKLKEEYSNQWTPVWVEANTREEAAAFYEQYKNPPPDQRKETPTNGQDEGIPIVL